METNVRSPMDIFNLPQHLVIPLFQRPYVWDETEQWLPLWQDVRRLVELREAAPHSTATHFLGAIVVQAQDNHTGDLQSRSVIDGQQRLTTLQLLMDAAGTVMQESGLATLAGQLDALTHNSELYTRGEASRLKIRHTNKGHAAFDEVMNAEAPVDHGALKHAGALVTRAHGFFVRAVTDWLDEVDDAARDRRAITLVAVLARGLQLVVIDLKADENSQEIFETLNARGTPLTAADLVKNFVFQRLDGEGVDTGRAYREDWPFETKFWEAEVSVGRYKISRSSLFINQWLVSRVGEEISPKSTFNRFKHHVDHEAGRSMGELLLRIKEQADGYERWTVAAEHSDLELSPTQMAVYRMGAGGAELLKPVLIWLHDPDLAIPIEVADAVIGALESWTVRRQLLRLNSGDLGRIVAELIRAHRSAPAGDLAERVRTHLMRLGSASSYWPGDEEIRTSLLTENVYRRFPRARLRMLLEAIEDRARRTHRSPPVSRRGFPIEHVLPQKWESHWPVEGLEQELHRAARIHRLGNLTLLTESLNASVSNGPWTTKRLKLARHDLMLMNRVFQDAALVEWDEAAIDRRSGQMIEELLATWPVPEGHEGGIVQPSASDNAEVEVRHLVAAGLLAPGTRLVPRSGDHPEAFAVVRADGLIELDGTVHDTPSGAGKVLKGGGINGWRFWRLEDGRTLADVRAIFRGARHDASQHAPFDWSGLHVMLEALPDGRWTTCGSLAENVGTAAQAVREHMAGCGQCANVDRVLDHEEPADSDPTTTGSGEGPDPSLVLDGDALAELLEDARVGSR